MIFNRITAPKNQVFSCSKRDRHLSSIDQGLNPDPRKPPTTFLFLLIFNCQITDASKPKGQTVKTSRNSNTPRDQTETRSQPACANQSVISEERKSSSPAAPPPSFSERVIDPTTI
jgi:hypothetical protein